MCEYLKACRKDLTADRAGFAITFEVIMVSLLLALAITVIIFFTQVLNTQRFFYNVTAATCTAAARYGGDDSRAYEFQVQQSTGKTGTISDTANAFLTAVSKVQGTENMYILEPGSSGKYITVSSVSELTKSTSYNNWVTVEMNFKLGDYGLGHLINTLFPMWSSNETKYTVKMPSLMQYGQLLVKEKE